MEIFDWKVINNYNRGKFALEFHVSKFDEDEIRYKVNEAIKKIQSDLKEERKNGTG